MYDWANSVYQLTIGSTIFPIYYNAVTRHGTDYTVNFFGYKAINTVLYSWSIAASYLVVALFSPLFSSIADYTGLRKRFMMDFHMDWRIVMRIAIFSSIKIRLNWD